MFSNILLIILPKSLRLRWGLDESERKFIKQLKPHLKAATRTTGPRLLVQMPPDYFCLALFSLAISYLRPSVIRGLWHQSIVSSPRQETFSPLRYFGRNFARFFDQRKWSRLYKALGINSFFNLEPIFWSKFLNRIEARRIFLKLATKQDLLDLRLNGLACGDLIYDTYLRYRVQPTVDVKDPYLRHLIAKALDAQLAANKIFQRGRFEILLTNYTSYIQHGIPARVALECGVHVYSAGNLSQFFKRLSLEDSLHTTEHWSYKERFAKLEDQGLARSQAKNMLKTRFAGGVDKATLYMKSSAFTNSKASMPSGIEGVVFLHDFFDSPHCHRSMLFPDFLDWIRYTLGVIEEYRLPIAVKPHPNQLAESREVVAKLQEEFPSICWLPSNLSNRVIFDSGIRCGISVYGTILHELAFHGIAAIAAGDHPHSAFDIAITPNTIEKYRQCLIHFRELRLSDNVQEEVLSFYYMHNIHKNEGIDINFDRWDLRGIGPNDSKRLGIFLNTHPDYPSLES
jgi:hypothetical protein